jgi:hypothetical protein
MAPEFAKIPTDSLKADKTAFTIIVFKNTRAARPSLARAGRSAPSIDYSPRCGAQA